MLGVFVAGLVSAAAFTLLPARFTAFALLQVASKPNPFLARDNNREEFLVVMKTTAARLKSRDVLMRTLSQDPVRNLGLIKKHPDTLSTLTWLEEYLKIEIQDNSELLTVSLTGDEPNDLQVIVNNMVKSFMAIVGNEDKRRSKDRLEKSKVLYEGAREKLTEKVNAKDNLLKGSGVKDPWTMMNALQVMQGDQRVAQNDLSHFRFDLERKNAQIANALAAKKNLEKFTGQEIPVKDLQDYDLSLRREFEQVERYEKFIERLVKEGHPPTDSTLRQAKVDLESTKKKADERAGTGSREASAKNAQETGGGARCPECGLADGDRAAGKIRRRDARAHRFADEGHGAHQHLDEEI